MNHIVARLKIRGSGQKFKKILTTEDAVYENWALDVSESIPYATDSLLDEQSWYKIPNFSEKEFYISEFSNDYSSVDFPLLLVSEFEKIDYIFISMGSMICVQNTSKSKLISKKRVLHIGEDYKFDNHSHMITINDIPDAIYEKHSNTLYFKKLSSITSVFKGIDQLYREATQEEVQSFLKNDFIALENGFAADNVKTPNRRRIALAADTLGELSDDEKKQVFRYIKDYCPDLQYADNTFHIANEEELKQLLFGIEQRYYTTIVGGEKRLANSVIKL